MKDFPLYRNDSIRNGILIGLLIEIVSALIVLLILRLLGETGGTGIRRYAACFILPIVLVRHIARRKEKPLILKGLIITLFITIIVYFYLLLRSGW